MYATWIPTSLLCVSMNYDARYERMSHKSLKGKTRRQECNLASFVGAINNVESQ